MKNSSETIPAWYRTGDGYIPNPNQEPSHIRLYNDFYALAYHTWGISFQIDKMGKSYGLMNSYELI